MNNDDNNLNNNVIRSKNVSGGYESLDDEYTKEDIQKEHNMSIMNTEMNKMNNIEVEKVDNSNNNFLTNLKNKGMELFKKIRGEAHTDLSSSELRKMDLQNKMNNIEQPAMQQPKQEPVQPKKENVVQPQVQQAAQKPVQQPQQIPQQPIQQQVKQVEDPAARAAVFAGLGNGNNSQQKKGFLSNIFNRNKSNQTANSGDNVEPWMMNQPLSAQSLGVSQNEIKKEVVVHDDNSKYFNASSDTDRVAEDNKLRPENFAKPLFQKKVKPNKELEKKQNGTLLRNYLGNSYDSISMGVFSISALLFGGLYLIANRLILIGLGVFGIQMYILLFIPWQRAVIYYAILALILAFVSSPLILFIAKSKVKFIRMTHPKYVEVQLEELCKRKNKSYTNLSILILLATIGVTSYMFIVNHYKFKGPIGNGYRYIEKMYDSYSKSEVIEIKYDDSVNVSDYFTFKLDDSFSKKDNYYEYVTEAEGENNTCKFSFRKVSNFSDANSLLQAVKSLNKTGGKIETEEINGVVFAKLDYDTDKAKMNYLSIKYNKEVFLINMTIGKDTPQNVCSNMFEDFKGSLEKVEIPTEEKK